MLTQRAQVLLKTLVERYISDGQPVGSRTLSRYSGLDLSPASIRNVMSDLEEMGYIVSPHTSAGRVPTPQGYRVFVDCLLTVKPLESLEEDQLRSKLRPDDPHRLITSASQLLSELTRFAGVVVAPRDPDPRFRQIEFVRLAEKRILLIIVTTGGDVQNRVLLTTRAYAESELVQAANFFNAHFSGCTLSEMRTRIHKELRELSDSIGALMAQMLQASDEGMRKPEEDVIVSGERNLLRMEDFSSNVSGIRRLFEVFEHKTELLRLLDISQHAQGVQIFIGGESELMPLDDCSMVTAPYTVDGLVVGTLGVVGPTRMAYQRVVPLVDITARLLSSALSHH